MASVPNTCGKGEEFKHAAHRKKAEKTTYLVRPETRRFQAAVQVAVKRAEFSPCQS